MSANSRIEWTEATWNPVVGCTKVSPGCANCYAERMAYRLACAEKAPYNAGIIRGAGDAGKPLRARWTGKVALNEAALARPLHWRKPRRIFVCSMSDLFQESVPFEWIDRVFAVMALCPQHTFQVLTKRPERMAEWLTAKRAVRFMGHAAEDKPVWHHVSTQMNGYYRNPVPNTYRLSVPIEFGDNWPLPNVWLGTSVENQMMADARIPHLLRCPATVRFLSAEPLLGPVDLANIRKKGIVTDAIGGVYWAEANGKKLTIDPIGSTYEKIISWVIVGGESGPGARPCNIEWIRSIVGQCKTAGVACFVKQLGANPELGLDECWGKDGPPGDAKGGDPDEWPEDLRVREMPTQVGGNQ